MKCYYDFHIHSCLSPCGDIDMTPNNIVNMAIIKGLDAIALTDHNRSANCTAVKKCAEGKLVVLCGMEIESSDEVHMICLFEDEDSCSKAERVVIDSMNGIKNDIDIFGEQLIMDENDDITGNVDDLLVSATSLSVYEICDLVHKFGGVCIAAHVDKSSYSIISNLGFIADDMEIDAIEISKNGDYEKLLLNNSYLRQFKPIFSSDAHYLTDISERKNYIEVEEITPTSIMNAIKLKK